MITLIEEIKADALQARKNNLPEKGLLVTLIGEIEMVAKNAQREVTDADCVSKVKAFRKNLTELLEHTTDNTKRGDICIEFNCLEKYMPQQLSEADLRAIIQMDIIKENGYTSMRDMGACMKQLKANFDGQYDGATASRLVKELLS